ncbi:PTS sugar transporter subunit IIB [Niallia sp. NCCP-28]|uniref:PTS sugar transporter subunit IIB n=1 Tax=Niallia sp. NCCP-28 TaxID=2934712 RepID=UPI00208B70F5|nr:PTS sugar transporter subunit IIB [Niallia sp. NCCP-28]GKU84859.1 PTS sugar transporter subunit IIB [Niallia sp. NCCP-28]
MKTIVLVCAAGMSTSLLVTKMKRAAKIKSIEVNIFAVSVPEVDLTVKNKNIDVLLLAPQVKYKKKFLEELVADKNIPMEDINVQYYGKMDGEQVLEQALTLIDSN